MSLKQTLKHLGLSDKEARIYLALLELGTSTAPKISQKAEIKRPTTYVLLDELRKKELVLVLPKRSKTLYTVKSPEKLIQKREEENKEISYIMPEIFALFNNSKEKPRICFYEGEKEILNLYNKEIFQEKEILFIVSMQYIPKSILKNFSKHMNRVKNGEIHIREIQSNDPVSQAFRKKYQCPYYHIKTVSTDFPIQTDNAIFANKVALFSYKNKYTPVAVVIESNDVATTYRSLFQLAWNGIKK